MKKILVSCGSGIATSTVVNHKISTYLDEHGYKDQYRIEQCLVSEVPQKSSNADFCVSTSVIGGDVKCPVLMGLPFLTGIGADKLYDSIMELMKK